MRRIRALFAAHPRLTTALHVILAALPTVLTALFILGLAGVYFSGEETFYGVLMLAMYAGVAAFFGTGVFWLLSLLTYRFTHAVREMWPDWLRMGLIRLNIIGGLLTVVQLWLWVQWLIIR